MIFLNEGIVVLNSIPFTRVFDVSFRCVAVDFNEELWRRGEKKSYAKNGAVRGEGGHLQATDRSVRFSLCVDFSS